MFSLAMLVLKHIRDRYFLGWLGSSIQAIQEAAAHPSAWHEFSGVLVYIWETREDVSREDLTHVVEKAIGRKGSEGVMTTADKLRQEGRQEGRQDIILRQIRAKFGEVTQELRERLERADAKTLELWAERILTANTYEEVIAE